MRTFLQSAVGLAAIGTIADVVPLRGENRIIVRYGLESFAEQASIGLQALLRICEIDRERGLGVEDVSFSIARAAPATDSTCTQGLRTAPSICKPLAGMRRRRASRSRPNAFPRFANNSVPSRPSGVGQRKNPPDCRSTPRSAWPTSRIAR
jgi:hypothetical protein